MPVAKLLLGVLGGGAVVYGTLTAGMYCAMVQPPERFGAIMSHVPMLAMMVVPFEPLWNRARGGTLQIGDAAPDFTLPRLGGGGSVKLSDELGARSVALIFGSYT
jgi:hypothetical protein